MKTILCITDFSASCDNAIDYANELARLLGSRLLLVHNLYTGEREAALETAPGAESRVVEPLRRLEAVQRRLEYNATDSRITYAAFVREGPAHENIAALVQEEQVDLVVLGSEEANGLKDILVGTVAGEVIAATTCPVLVVPQKASFRPLRKIVFAVGKINDAQHNTALVLQLARHFDAEILFLHVFQQEKAGVNAMAEEEFYRLNSWHGYQNVSMHMVLNEHIEDGISAFTRKTRADMLVMSYHADTPWQHLFTKDYTQEEAFHTYLPMLFTRALQA